jgi:hypothetical protein
MIPTPATSGVTVRRAGSTATSGAPIGPRELPIINLFAQTISLDTINYFGPGQQSVEAGRSVFGERQSIVGGDVVYPLSGIGALAAWHPAVVGGIAGRFINIRSGQANDAPSIENVYTGTTAPGLDDQHPFLELREALRVTPSILDGRLAFNYSVTAQQFRTAASANGSFNRWSLDLRHEIPLYGHSASTGARPFNGPDDCAQGMSSTACPPVQWSRNREGAIAFRMLLVTSTTGSGNRVPFYLQPTLGGSDIDGERLLASYQDYRFRAPDLIAFQESIEHSVWGPVGAFLTLEQGRVAERPGDLSLSGLATSASVGVTLRAGGFPMVHLSFSWGGEGHHVIGAMNTSLLGGSARPDLQ